MNERQSLLDDDAFQSPTQKRTKKGGSGGSSGDRNKIIFVVAALAVTAGIFGWRYMSGQSIKRSAIAPPPSQEERDYEERQQKEYEATPEHERAVEAGA